MKKKKYIYICIYNKIMKKNTDRNDNNACWSSLTDNNCISNEIKKIEVLSGSSNATSSKIFRILLLL